MKIYTCKISCIYILRTYKCHLVHNGFILNYLFSVSMSSENKTKQKSNKTLQSCNIHVTWVSKCHKTGFSAGKCFSPEMRTKSLSLTLSPSEVLDYLSRECRPPQHGFSTSWAQSRALPSLPGSSAQEWPRFSVS